MLFLVFGSSAAGKTAALSALRGRVADLAIHDFDEIGVPVDADRAWRHRSNEIWLRRALVYQRQGIDLLLAGQTPLGELLATPSAPLVDGISACLADCDDETRIRRLEGRGAEWGATARGDLGDYLSWAAWMRRHATDPSWLPEVIVFPARSPTSTLKSTVSAFFGAVPRIVKVAYWPFGIRPPDQVTACPVRFWVQPGFASASSSSKSAGMPSVTWSTGTGSFSFG